ncbi:MAG: hypothetical protein E6H70_03105 [Betaproteobacteria bacterium]|nr:MAG: hypothetical protein E6H70_03105 [Betaproteobacteria bacterium]
MKRLGKWLAARKAIEIVEEGGVRVLQIGGNAIQSAVGRLAGEYENHGTVEIPMPAVLAAALKP